MYWATADEPTKPTALTRASVRMVSTASLSPLSTLSTPAGRPASMSNSASRIGTDGSRSEGFGMKALPQASAGANFHIGIMAGEIKGPLAPTKPRRLAGAGRFVPAPAQGLYSPHHHI